MNHHTHLHIFLNLRAELLVKKNKILKFFFKPLVHHLKSSSKNLVLKLYSNQILWKGPFPLPKLGIMIVVHIFHLTGPNKLYQFIFVIFITARVEHC